MNLKYAVQWEEKRDPASNKMKAGYLTTTLAHTKIKRKKKVAHIRNFIAVLAVLLVWIP